MQYFLYKLMVPEILKENAEGNTKENGIISNYFSLTEISTLLIPKSVNRLRGK